ncbi:reversion-inducing cysteine-rich protein with Kazal motifs-like isoform X2 [Artemia franciscana]
MFWSCINRHTRGELWAGSTCCHLGHSWLCQTACVNATSQADIQHSCRKSDEIELYKCFEQKMKNDHCCKKAKLNRDCSAACHDIIHSDTNGHAVRMSRVISSCSAAPEVLNCLGKRFFAEQKDSMTSLQKGSNIYDNDDRLSCCKESKSAICQEGCQGILRSSSDDSEIMNELEAVCDQPHLMNSFWQCIILKSSSNKNQTESKRKQRTRSPMTRKKISKDAIKFEDHIKNLGIENLSARGIKDYSYGRSITNTKHVRFLRRKKNEENLRQTKVSHDVLKLKCCDRATSNNCRGLCEDVYSEDHSKIIEFEKQCLQNSMNLKLGECLLDVDEPCQLGCDGLNFCSLFNGRSADVFRSCRTTSDNAAQIDYASWVSGKSGIKFLDHRLPVNVTKCHPELWQAFSCYHHIKPCGQNHDQLNMPRICWRECYDLLFDCLEDSDRANMASYMCNIFADKSESDCISLKEYLDPKQKQQEEFHKVKNPCSNSKHCTGSTEICIAESNNLDDWSYSCAPGCSISRAQTHKVSAGTWIFVPCQGEYCSEICKCSENGSFGSCNKLSPTKPKSCMVGDREVEHGLQFKYDCNVCGCSGGELTCTKRKCSRDATIKNYSGLPCKCPEIYAPVCGKNGKTYPNQCIARCNMQVNTKPGPCSIRGDGNSTNCHMDEVKIPVNIVCLAYKMWQDKYDCPQAICVPKQPEACSFNHLGQVCDIYGRTHRTICKLVQANVPFSNWGSCQSTCLISKTVCGVDSNTYGSECEAKARGILVDYTGPCTHVGKICSTIQCPPVPEGCVTSKLPGTCCPKCLSFIRLLPSSKQMYKIVMATESQELLSVSYLLTALESFKTVSECLMGGYLHYEGEVIVYIFSEDRYQNVCNIELARIHKQILYKSPRVQIDAILSTVVAADRSFESNSLSTTTMLLPSNNYIFVYILLLTISRQYGIL